MANVRTNVPLSGDERASERIAINLHLIAFAAPHSRHTCTHASVGRPVVSFTTVVRCALILIFSRKVKGRRRESRGSGREGGTGIGLRRIGEGRREAAY